MTRLKQANRNSYYQRFFFFFHAFQIQGKLQYHKAHANSNLCLCNNENCTNEDMWKLTRLHITDSIATNLLS